ncbi:DUF2195 family protein [Brucella sp. LJL56]
MLKLISGVVPLALLCGVAGAADAGGIAFENKLAGCVTVTGEKAVVKEAAISVKTRFQFHKPIGDCGCFSARAVYTSSVDIGGERELLQQGIIVSNKNMTKTLVLASDVTLVGDRTIHVQLNCAGPT